MRRTYYLYLLLFLFGGYFSSLTAQDSINYETAFPALSFRFPVEIQHAGDGSDRLFVVEQAGTIRVFANRQDVQSAATFLDVTDVVSFSAGQEIGLLGLAFHPQFTTNGYFYIYHTRKSSVADVNVELVLARYQVSADDPNRADPSSRLEIFSFDKNQRNSNHNGGKIAFGPDGYLYASLGDGGGGGDPQQNAQDLGTIFGSILRIDVDVDGNNPLETNPATPNGNYEIPSDNPRVGQSGLDELYAWGIRNTWKFSFDEATGRLWGGDVGQGSFEEINLIEAGGNYGWNRFEANSTFSSSATLATNPDTKPVYAYDHDDGDVSITLGYVYRGPLQNPAIQGKLIFGDYVSGRVWALDYAAGSGTATAQLLFRTRDGERVSSFGLDEAGALYFSGYDQQTQLFRIVDENDPAPTATAVDGIGDWQSLGEGVAGTVDAVVSNGSNIYAAGSFETAGGSSAGNIAVYSDADGWRSLSTGSNGRISALALGSDGRLYAGGNFTTIGGTTAQHIAVWDGSSWAALGAGTDGAVLALGISPEGEVFAGGTFVTAGGITANNIARWDGNWSALTDSGTGVPGTNNEVRSIAFDEENTVYIGGNFASAGDRPANRIATFDGSNWGSLGSGTSGFVQAIAVTGSSVYIGGNFATAGEQTVNRIARWDRTTDQWQAIGQGVSDNVNALVHDGTHLYAGGNFETATLADGTRYIVRNIARWSAELEWEALGPDKDVGTDTRVNAISLPETGGLVVGGSFEVAGSTTAPGIARWTIGDIVDGAVYELEPQHDTKLRLHVRGSRTRNGTEVDGIARTGNSNQQWTFIEVDAGVYELAPVHAPTKRLDVQGADEGTNASLIIWDRHGRANQRWKVLPVGDGTYRFSPGHAPDKRLDIDYLGGMRRGLSRTLDSGNSQRWRLIPVPQAQASAPVVQSASETQRAPAIQLYPNPVTDQLTVESPYAHQLSLHDISGRTVYQRDYPEGIHRVNVNDLSHGVYIVRLVASGQRPVSRRIVVE
ncbi:hypothetical protein LEM8419_00048 [Neolewinella maritima]|uniref:T9SS type A sorting domain-containing protein n=1 Tax=Neolewinella maritima TaxID=1383882 RepID=A0ABM9AX04_9BACT|nr:PQQ-dependent sugar dehydrogenase [Neolewinella maritima]CAH0998702.1 hypothetical protein LEM8419_00048 [Neolewinella maritima]